MSWLVDMMHDGFVPNKPTARCWLLAAGQTRVISSVILSTISRCGVGQLLTETVLQVLCLGRDVKPTLPERLSTLIKK